MVAVAYAMQSQRVYLFMQPCDTSYRVPTLAPSQLRDKQLLGSLCWPSRMHLHSAWLSR